jgi:hypothetical protein
MNDYCQKHKPTPDAIVDMLEALPRSQAGAQRHACAACALECGIEIGRQLERAAMIAHLQGEDDVLDLSTPEARTLARISRSRPGTGPHITRRGGIGH